LAYTSSLRPAVLGRPVAVFSLLVAVSTTLGCGESEPTPSSTATTAAALYGAGVTVDMASNSGYRAAVGQIAVTVTGGGMSCSATALAPQTVLTAAHCVCDWCQASQLMSI
jgi:V8-like Glu-specific endopeptidase